MSATNRGSPRQAHDYYRTPLWCVQALYMAVDLPSPTLDPCAGTGALLEAARGLSWDDESPMRGIEQQAHLAAASRVPLEVGDGLAVSWEGEHILMNPPYNAALEWVEKGVREAASVTALLRLAFLASQRRKPFMEAFPPARLVVMSKRPRFLQKRGGDSSDYAWFHWAQGHKGPTHLTWIN